MDSTGDFGRDRQFPWTLDEVNRYLRSMSQDLDTSGHLITKVLIGLLVFFIRKLSWKGTDRLGACIGYLMYWLKIRKSIAMTNLNIAFSNTKTEEEKDAIYKGSLINMGRHILNYMRVPLMDEKFWSDFELEGEEKLKEIVNRGKGLVILGGHIGEWEIATSRVGMAGYPVSMVAKRMPNPVIDKFLIDARLDMNQGTIPSKASMDRIIKGIKEHGEAITMAIDQNMMRHRAVFVKFLGRIASVPRSVAWIVRETGAPVITGYSCRIAPGKFKTVLTEEVPWEPHPEDPEEEIRINSRNHARAVEKIIYDNPELWLWVHRRFKVQPEGTPAPYRK
ncbi:lysophospholipid acyltransferase family protein [Thermodesulfobacteriota bacterium]